VRVLDVVDITLTLSLSQRERVRNKKWAKDSEIAPRRREGRGVSEFLIKNCSELCELCASMVNTEKEFLKDQRWR
jgi:hypothetical protein